MRKLKKAQEDQRSADFKHLCEIDYYLNKWRCDRVVFISDVRTSED